MSGCEEVRNISAGLGPEEVQSSEEEVESSESESNCGSKGAERKPVDTEADNVISDD